MTSLEFAGRTYAPPSRPAIRVAAACDLARAIARAYDSERHSAADTIVHLPAVAPGAASPPWLCTATGSDSPVRAVVCTAHEADRVSFDLRQ